MNLVDAEKLYRRAIEIIHEETVSRRPFAAGSVREEQARGVMVVLGHLLGYRTFDTYEREKWLPGVR